MSSLAERLGFGAEDRVAIIHVDDVGMSHAANVGAFEAMTSGVATCGSIMAPCPWFPEAVEIISKNSALDIGVHLTLNAEWEGYRWGPVAGASVVPTLVDEQGYLKKDLLETVAMAKPEEVKIEMRAQIDRALKAGIDVTHLDSHMGTILYNQQLLEIYLELGKEYQIPIFLPRWRIEQLEKIGLAPAVPILEKFLARMEEAGLPVIDGFDIDSVDFSPGEGVAHNKRRLEELRPGVSYLVCHAAKRGAELDAITPDAHARELERTFYSGDAARQMLASLGIRTVGMRPLRALMRTKSD